MKIIYFLVSLFILVLTPISMAFADDGEEREPDMVDSKGNIIKHKDYMNDIEKSINSNKMLLDTGLLVPLPI